MASKRVQSSAPTGKARSAGLPRRSLVPKRRGNSTAQARSKSPSPSVSRASSGSPCPTNASATRGSCQNGLMGTGERRHLVSKHSHFVTVSARLQLNSDPRIGSVASADRLTAHPKKSGFNEFLSLSMTWAHGSNQLRSAVRFDHASPSGKRTTASSPSSGELRSKTEPPCAWMMVRAIARPRPTPPVSRLRELSNLTKGSKTASS